MQTFSYALKLKLVFVVLNQLLAVAARGVRKESFEERRYHHSSTADAFSADCRKWDKSPTYPIERHDVNKPYDRSKDPSSTGSIQVTVPSPVIAKQHQTSVFCLCRMILPRATGLSIAANHVSSLLLVTTCRKPDND